MGYAKRDLVLPQAPFTDLHAANAAARQWCAEVNGVPHSEIAAVPAERLAVEAELLGVLPSLRPTIGRTQTTRKVDRLSCVRFGSARYSVPARLIGSTVARPAPRRAVRPKTEAEKAFCALGSVAEAFITDSAASGNTRLASDLEELAVLQAAHGKDALLASKTGRCWHVRPGPTLGSGPAVRSRHRSGWP